MATLRHRWEEICSLRTRNSLLTLLTITAVGSLAGVATVPLLLGVVACDRFLAGPARTWAKAEPRTEFKMENYSEATFKRLTRFKKKDFERLFIALRLPDRARTTCGDNIPGREALFIHLVRMAAPGSWGLLLPSLNWRSESGCKRAFYFVLDHIYDEHKWAIDDINRWRDRMPEFCVKNRARGCYYRSCFAWIDGTLRVMCRPRGGWGPFTLDGIQRLVFNGHQRQHGFKYQSIFLPNGLVGDFYGPIVGRRSDSYLFDRSDFESRMQTVHANTNGMLSNDGVTSFPFVVYGDPAYFVTPCIQRAHKGPNMTPTQQRQNTLMRRSRIAVEWGFSEVVNQWRYLDYPHGLKEGLQPLGKIYTVAVLLANMHTCVYALRSTATSPRPTLTARRQCSRHTWTRISISCEPPRRSA
jgi:hypothetical protein